MLALFSWIGAERNSHFLLERDIKGTMQRRGIVDLGSNTARLVDYLVEPGQWFRLAHQIRQPVRLGEGLGRDGLLSEPGMERAEKALELFGQYSRSTGLGRLEVLGTSALRDAANRDDFLRRVSHLGLDIEVLSGEDEARLGVLAVANGFDLEDAAVMDLGGGSAQLSFMQARQFSVGQAYPLGAVRLSERFLSSDPPKRRQVEALEAAVESELGGIAQSIRQEELPLVAMGGTIRNLARTIQKVERYPLADRLHGYFVRRDALEKLTERLLELSAKRRTRVPGIKRDRADVIVAGALVFRWLVRSSELSGIWISGHGLREGALFKGFIEEPHLIPDVRAFSVQNVLSHYTQPKEHVDQVRRLAGQVFEGLRPLHQYGEREKELLDAAAVLQDIGLAVNYYRHDRHGGDLVASGPLNGFTHREQVLLAQLVRFHLRGKPRLGAYRRLCQPGDEKLLTRLAACLRLADHLDRSRSQTIRDLRVDIGKRVVRVVAYACRDPRIELEGIEVHEQIFEAGFDGRLKVKAMVGSAPPE
jgi:exopolyphosphatase/guanosine-5'-triphosphate,3'-diphosphate pyrophosphatase